MKTLACVLVLLSAAAAQPASVDRIRDLQNERRMHSPELLADLSSSDAHIRSAALIALANIQDTTAVEDVLPLLLDKNSVVRRDAAFCLGMMGSHRATATLIERFLAESDSTVLAEIAQAIGKCGSEDDLARLVILMRTVSVHRKDAFPLMCARFAIRKINGTSAYPLLIDMLRSPRTQFWATYALMRFNDSSIVRVGKHALLRNLKHRDPVIAMWTAAILGTSSESSVIHSLLDFLASSQDWRMKVTIIRALQSSHRTDVASALRRSINDPNEHVSLTAIGAYDHVLSDSVFAQEKNLFEFILADAARYTFRQRGEAAAVLGRRGGRKEGGMLQKFLGEDRDLDPFLLRALGATGDTELVPILAERLSSADSRICTAAVEAYGAIAEALDAKRQQTFIERIVPLFSRRDPGIALSVAAVFEDTAITAPVRHKALPALIVAFDSMESGNDVEPMVELLTVFGQMKDSTALPAVQRSLRDKDWTVRSAARAAFISITHQDPPPASVDDTVAPPHFSSRDLSAIADITGADIFTTKGTIRIRFRPDAAPFTVLNFVLLAKKGFFDGLTFHRVVSNFVIQGGDPMGNGSGGPGYAIRTEVFPSTLYTAGAVGMASAGKDTEGSQFFITHCPTPHLDGRYTIFGYTDDHAVVDKIMVGDKIVKIVTTKGKK